jgi:hypothetical protein
MPRSPTQSTLPNVSRLALVRTGSPAEDGARLDPLSGDNSSPPRDHPAASTSPSPSETATHRDQYTETADFFHAVLDQIKNGEDRNAACQAARVWCALDKGRRAACASWKEWENLARALFTTYVPVPNESTMWQAHVFTLCNMDPVDRLVLIGKERMSFEKQRREKENSGLQGQESEDDDDDDYDPSMVLFKDLYESMSAWTTERDDEADVALAVTRIYNPGVNLAITVLVVEKTVTAIIQLLDRIHTNRSKSSSLREGEQLALLCSWVFSRQPLIFTHSNLVPLKTHLGKLTDVLYTTIGWGLHGVPRASVGALAKHSNHATACLQALGDIARYKEDGVDWSEHATPHSQRSLDDGLCALQYYLRNGDRNQKMSVCALISYSLRVPTNWWASTNTACVRKLKFAEELKKTSVMDELTKMVLDDDDLSPWSIAALEAIRGRLSAHPPRRINGNRLMRSSTLRQGGHRECDTQI